jgi:hypothetical protein
MGIRSTKDISRYVAIKRILKMDALIIDKHYLKIEPEISEEDGLSYLVDVAETLGVDEDTLKKWTDTMLGDQMDYPLYRFSMFENYLVSSSKE